MNKTLKLLLAVFALFSMTACMDDHDEPNTDNYLITSPTSIGETNYSIAQLKQDKKSLFTQKNEFEEVKEDRILEGVVVANDCGGNLYQTLLIRHIDKNKAQGDPLRDQAIVLSIKHTWLTPYFQLGQRIKVNLKGLYIGTHSYVPKIGQPYFTSNDNLRLGPVLLQLCSTNVELVGTPDPNCEECQPLILDSKWLSDSSKKNPFYTPLLATITGEIFEADGKSTFAPDSYKDGGFGVNRILEVGSTDVIIRTSTQNNISYTIMPMGMHKFTGLLSYYSGWQIQLRTVNDIQ